MYNLHFPNLQCTMYSLHCTVYITLSAESCYSRQTLTVYSVQYTIYNLQRTVCNIDCLVYIVMYTVNSLKQQFTVTTKVAQCTVYNAADLEKTNSMNSAEFNFLKDFP